MLSSVTRLGDLLDLRQVFKTINLPKSLTFLGNFGEGAKIYHFWVTFGIWQFFSGHTDAKNFFGEI